MKTICRKASYVRTYLYHICMYVCATHMHACSLRDRVAQQGSKHMGTGLTHNTLCTAWAHHKHAVGTTAAHISCRICTSCAGRPVLQCAVAMRLREDVLCMQYWICPSHTYLPHCTTIIQWCSQRRTPCPRMTPVAVCTDQT